MDKEKQIDGMIEAMSESCGSCFGSGEAECIYNAGYRKSSDVAREIFEEIDKIVICKVIHHGEIAYDVTDEYAELKKKYTHSEDTE